jgi:hypothetical protein
MNAQETAEKYHKHVAVLTRYQAGRVDMAQPTYVWHLCLARGYRRDLTAFALAGDEVAGNLVLGAPHFITYSDEQVKSMA